MTEAEGLAWCAEHRARVFFHRLLKGRPSVHVHWGMESVSAPTFLQAVEAADAAPVQAEPTVAEVADLFRHEQTIVCYSRCIVCGRRTPHEVCHLHADHSTWPKKLDNAWLGDRLDAEPCDNPGCPQWDTDAEREAARERSGA
jgi:hypothetical protein